MLPSRRTDHQTHSRVAVAGKRSIWGIVEVFHKRGILSWPAYRKDGRTDGRAQFRPLARKILWEAYGVQPMKCHALNIASYTTPVSQRDNYVRNIIVKVTQIYICIFVWFCHFHMLSIHTLRPPPFFFYLFSNYVLASCETVYTQFPKYKDAIRGVQYTWDMFHYLWT